MSHGVWFPSGSDYMRTVCTVQRCRPVKGFSSYYCTEMHYLSSVRIACTMDEGRERDKTSRRGGPSYAAQSKAQYISAFATRVLQSTYVYVKWERAWARIFKLFRTPGIISTKLADWFRKPVIFLLYSHYYICRRNWFFGNFCTF
jgi:hypothetical protein